MNERNYFIVWAMNDMNRRWPVAQKKFMSLSWRNKSIGLYAIDP